MKILKKLSSVVLAALLALSMSVMAFAAENPTIELPKNTGHTYEIYQIFTGDLSTKTVDGEEVKVLSNIKWGKNGTGTEGESVDSTILAELSALTGSDASKLETITEYVKLDTDAFESDDAGAVVRVPTGYYLIKDMDKSVSGNDAYSLYMVEVVGPVTLEAKSDVPSVEKKVKDINDSETTTPSDWQDSADHDIGDVVSFKLTGTLPDNYADYKTYYYEFHDTLSAGLTYKYDTENHPNGDATVTIVNADGTTDVTSEFDITEEDGKLNIKCADLKELTVDKDSNIVVEYTAKLNENAVIGSAGNPNTVNLEFSNNPNSFGDGTPGTPDTPEKPETGTTPDDTVIVFTYKLVVDKFEMVKGEEQALKGAGFTLYKQDAQGNFEAVGDELKGEEMTQFTWKGLDDGIYKLSETTVPTGYNAINDIYFEVEATHTEGAVPELTSLQITKIGTKAVDNMANTGKDGDVYSVSDATLTDGSVTSIGFTCTATDGTMATKIENKSGVTLPSTGGMGTTFLYIAGSVMVVAAGVLLITKKRMQK